MIESLEVRELLAAAPWNAAAKLIGQDLLAAKYPNLTGTGQTVVVIDSGVDYNHPSLGGGLGSNKKVIAGYDFMQNDADPMCDTFGHGTAVAGVIAASAFEYDGAYSQGIAPGVKLIALRESNSNQVKSALQWVINNRTKYNIVAVNITDYGGPWGTLYKTELASLINSGVFIANPAGNGGAKVPAGEPVTASVASIGSVNPAGSVSSFSQRGKYLDLLAPGEGVTITYYEPSTKKHIYVDDSWGTSWASPVVTATAALIKQIDPRFTPAQILQIMKDSGTPTYDSATKLTYKRINVYQAVTLAYKQSGAIITPQPPSNTGGGTSVTSPKRAPFYGTPTQIAGTTTLQLEDFDTGGEGVAYHDAESANRAGSTYRNGDGVDVRKLAAGGYAVESTWRGEWLEYTVNVPATTTFKVTARVGSHGPGGTFHINVDGSDKSGPIAVPNTGAWGTLKTTSATNTMTLSAGKHTLRVKMDSVGSRGFVGVLDSITFTPVTSAPASNAAKNAFQPMAATNYSNHAGTQNQGWYVGSLDQQDWIAFKGIDFGASGATRFAAGIAAANGWAGKRIQIRDGSTTGKILGSLTVSATGGWTTFKTQTASISKITGVHDIYLTFSGQAAGNLQWFKFS